MCLVVGSLRLYDRQWPCCRYGSCRTLACAEAASLTFLRVDVCYIALDGDGVELADFLTLTASDASSLAVLLRYCALVLVHACHIDSVWHLLYDASLRAYLDDVAWTGLGACSA